MRWILNRSDLSREEPFSSTPDYSCTLQLGNSTLSWRGYLISKRAKKFFFHFILRSSLYGAAKYAQQYCQWNILGCLRDVQWAAGWISRQTTNAKHKGFSHAQWFLTFVKRSLFWHSKCFPLRQLKFQSVFGKSVVSMGSTRLESLGTQDWGQKRIKCRSAGTEASDKRAALRQADSQPHPPYLSHKPLPFAGLHSADWSPLQCPVQLQWPHSLVFASSSLLCPL